MNPVLIRKLVWPAGLLGAVVAVLGMDWRSHTAPDLLSPTGPSGQPDLVEESRRREQQAADQDFLLTCVSRKVEIARGVLHGRLTLLEAAASFQEVESQRPPHLRTPPDPLLPARSEDERLCLAVIGYVDSLLEPGPERTRLVARLEAELRTRQERDGGLRLPGFPER